jgi:hypothetical protein
MKGIRLRPDDNINKKGAVKSQVKIGVLLLTLVKRKNPA